MISVIHYTPQDDSMITSYVDMLTKGMGLEAGNSVATTEAAARQLIESRHFDILHVHGCWQRSAAQLWQIVRKKGTRLVVSPYGQLEPWVVRDNYWKDKMPKKYLFQRHLIRSAYAVVIQGRMEEECMHQLGWNNRLVIIRNPLITHSTTAANAAQQTYHTYRCVMDSNPLALMTKDTRHTLRNIIKAGITGDRRWVQSDILAMESDEQWRTVLNYARQEHVDDIVSRGIRVLEYKCPDINITTQCFVPDGYERESTIQEAIGMQYPTENDRLIATFRFLRKVGLRHQLCISHLVELDKELREHDSEESLLVDMLKEARLYKTAQRMMQLMSTYTALDEGMMPLPPLNDRITRQLAMQIENHLKI